MLGLFVFFHSTLLLKGAKKVLDTSSHSLTVNLTSKEPMNQKTVNLTSKEPMNQKTPTFLCMEFIMLRCICC